MNDNTKERVMEFLGSTPVPYSGSPQWLEWQEQCNRIVGIGGKKILVDVLKTERESLHYGAMMALRTLGIPTGQTGEGDETVYEIYRSDKTIEESFHPIHPPEAPKDIEDDDPRWETRFEK